MSEISKPPKPKLVRLVVYVPEDLDRFLTMKALDDGRSLSSLARRIFDQYRKMIKDKTDDRAS